jgi:hypothetical protein
MRRSVPRDQAVHAHLQLAEHPGRTAVTRTRAGARTCGPERRDEAVTGAHQPRDGEQAGNEPCPHDPPGRAPGRARPNSEPTRSSPATSNPAAAMAPSTTRRSIAGGDGVSASNSLAHSPTVAESTMARHQLSTNHARTTQDPAPGSTEDHTRQSCLAWPPSQQLGGYCGGWERQATACAVVMTRCQPVALRSRWVTARWWSRCANWTWWWWRRWCRGPSPPAWWLSQRPPARSWWERRAAPSSGPGPTAR